MRDLNCGADARVRWLDAVGRAARSTVVDGLRAGRAVESDLRGIDLRGERLRGVDLREAELSFALLDQADLSGARLDRGCLFAVSAYGTCLDAASMSGSELSVANFARASLAGADVRGARCVATVFHGVDLSGADMRGAQLELADLEEARLVGSLRDRKRGRPLEARFSPGLFRPTRTALDQVEDYVRCEPPSAVEATQLALLAKSGSKGCLLAATAALFGGATVQVLAALRRAVDEDTSGYPQLRVILCRLDPTFDALWSAATDERANAYRLRLEEALACSRWEFTPRSAATPAGVR